jgi:hypothetical protein
MPLKYNLYTLFTGLSSPWDALGTFPGKWERLRIRTTIDPLLIGACFFVPVNVLGSIVFAQFFGQFVLVIARAVNITGRRGVSHISVPKVTK